jgi:hypothetical protein
MITISPAIAVRIHPILFITFTPMFLPLGVTTKQTLQILSFAAIKPL